MTLSVIIPTWNESATLPDCLEAVRRAGMNPEIVVVDGGSLDGTADVAAAAGVRVVIAGRGRARQLDAGWRAASSSVVMFLHADTWLPPGGLLKVIEVMSDPGVVGGGFMKTFRDGPFLLRWGAGWRCRVGWRSTGRLFGDQAVFVRREVLERLGGVPDWPLLEDVELSRRMAEAGRVVLLAESVSTSGRRFLEQGLWRTWWRMGRVMIGYGLGVDPRRLARWYRGR